MDQNTPAIGSFSEYISEAMRQARYKVLDDDGSWFGEIPGLLGVWGNAPTKHECAADLQSALEDWILVGLALHHEIPDFAGHSITIHPPSAPSPDLSPELSAIFEEDWLKDPRGLAALLYLAGKTEPCEP